MDLDVELRRVLEERSTAAPTVDVVGAVHRGMRRRRRRQRCSTAAVVMSVAAITVSGALVLRPSPDAGPLVDTQLNQTVPAGFAVSDLSWTSTSIGYALGTVPCAGRPCSIVLRTDSGGSDWVRHKAPDAAVVDRDGLQPEGCDTGTCVGHLRFAEDADGNEVGYAFGPGFAVTQDGAATWQSEPTDGGVEAVEAARRGTVVRVLSRPGGGHVVEQATVGDDDWRQVLAVDAAGSGALLKRQVDRLVLLTYDNVMSSNLHYSLDGGTTWSRGARSPCDADATTVAAALGKDHQVLVLCSRRTAGSAAYVRESVDDGRTFGAARDLPAGLSPTQVVAPSKGGWLVAGDAVDTNARVLLDSTDSGRSWSEVAKQPGRRGAVWGEGYLENSSSTTVWWVGPDPRVVWRSTDAGRSWTSATFR